MAGNVPQLDRLVITPRSEDLSVGAECYGRHRVGMPVEGGGVLTRRNVPQFDRMVLTPRDQGSAIGTPRHGIDPLRMSFQGGGDSCQSQRPTSLVVLS